MRLSTRGTVLTHMDYAGHVLLLACVPGREDAFALHVAALLAPPCSARPQHTTHHTHMPCTDVAKQSWHSRKGAVMVQARSPSTYAQPGREPAACPAIDARPLQFKPGDKVFGCTGQNLKAKEHGGTRSAAS